MEIGHNRAKVLLEYCDLALSKYSNGKRREAFGMLLTAVGVVASGAAIGQYYLNGKSDLNTAMLIPGVICFGAGIPLYFSGEKQVRFGIALHNQHCVKP